MKRIRLTLIITSIILISTLSLACSKVLDDSSVEKDARDTSNNELTDNNFLEEREEKSNDLLEVDEDVFRIYISADRTGAKESGISIEQGIMTALDEIDYKVNGKTIELVVLDHRGSTPRSKEHLNKYLEDDKALAIFSGLHSPPLLSERDFINQNKILMLDPWAAATPITRYPSSENWIFRLSIDDSKAGYIISRYAIEKDKFKKPYLLLEKTGWGESNEKTMKSALSKYGIDSVEGAWFNWNLGINQAKLLLRQAKESGSDVIFFVGNAPEGKVFAKAMSELEEGERLPIRSHWGITGGDFPNIIDKETRDKIDLVFIQTSFSFLDMDDHKLGNQVFERSVKLFPDIIKDVKDIKAPTGFVHSYDLSKILIEAIRQGDFEGGIVKTRDSIRVNLENLQNPIEGLVKTYRNPFSVYSSKNIDAHEALGIDDYVMARYGDDNEIILLK